MFIQNDHFFVSLFEPEGSGTIVFNWLKLKVEIDVKHSQYDWGDVPLTIGNVEKYPTVNVIYSWIPLKWNCQGIRINVFLYKND